MIRRLAAPLAILAVVGSCAIAGSAPVGAAVATRASSAYVYGIDSLVVFNCQTPTIWSTDATNQVQAIKALGANSIGLTFPLYTDSITSNAIYTQSTCGTNYQSPSPSQLSTVIKIAEAAKLHVFIRPLLDEVNLQKVNPLYWRGAIEPTNLTTWFANYLTTLTPYLRVAQSDHVSSFALSTELSSLNKAANWTKFIAAAHKIYTGSLVLTDSWASNSNTVVRSGTSLGIDAYRPVLAATGSWSPAQLLASWDKTLTSVKIPDISKDTLDEVGIAAKVDAYVAPNGTNGAISLNNMSQVTQVNWFTMGCAFMKTHKMKGIYYWGATMTFNAGMMPTQLTPNNPTAFQPETQIAIKNCFGVGSRPTVQSLSTKSGSTSGGTSVTISGTNFIGTFNVMFGKVPATSFTVVTSDQIVAVAPKARKGAIKIEVVTEQGASATGSQSAYTYK